MATRVLCVNAKFAPGNKNALLCKVDGEPCAFQMWCGIVKHATNTYSAEDCKNFGSVDNG